MLKEAATFADHLKHCEKDIRNLKNSSEGETDNLDAKFHTNFELGPIYDAIELKTC